MGRCIHPMNKFFTPFQNSENKPIVIVSGLPRSGTSMMMKMLAEGGLPVLTDAIRSADDDNPNGYFELEVVRKLKEGNFEWLKEANGKVVKVISALLEHLPQQYSYKIIFMEREPKEVLASQKKMLDHRGEVAGQRADLLDAELALRAGGAGEQGGDGAGRSETRTTIARTNRDPLHGVPPSLDRVGSAPRGWNPSRGPAARARG